MCDMVFLNKIIMSAV